MSDETIKVESSKNLISLSFVLVMLFLIYNVLFSWYSPSWVNSIGKVLIDEQKKDENGKPKNEKQAKIANVASLSSTRTVKLGVVKVETSLRGVTTKSLINVCDSKTKTKLDVKGDTRKGDQVTLRYLRFFKCKSINFRIHANDKFAAQLQTSADGIVFSTVEKLKAGSNNITLQNETIRAVRILISVPTKEKWSLGDVSCR
jgi:hypothetical protein